MSSPVVEGGWVLLLSLAAKCGVPIPVADRSILLFLSLLFFLSFFATALLHWAYPGGPAWGRYRRSRNRDALPSIPGPRGLPFLGSMGLMVGLAHRKLAAEAQTFDAKRLMAFTLGDTRLVVTADPDVAREILTSPAFADRPVKETAYRLMFDRAIGFAPYGVYWRTLRRIAATHLFSPKQIAASGSRRAEIAAQMTKTLAKYCDRLHVEVRKVIKIASLNNVMWSVFGRKYDIEAESEEMEELRAMVEEGYDMLGRINWSDHIPLLSGLDLQRIRSRCDGLVPRVNRFVSRIIQEHRQGMIRDPEAGSDFVDVLLSLQGEDKLSDADMLAVLWEMIFRGTDTVAVLIEWVLARLVLHQDVQARVHEELDRVVGRHRAVTGSDPPSLTYLQNVIKEALRMHPPGPLLSWARLATSDVHVDGRLVPAGTTAMVNMWAIARDPDVWADPLEFRPDRFAEPDALDLSLTGSDLRLAPFGSGRRSCPGRAMAMATVSFWVASLLHEFEWLPPSDGTPIDLSEVLRLSCEMTVPLAVKLRARRWLS
ncbi:cytochrome P450 78A9-like [Typha angustifolia]|uniref:cytochrome P450 78A9-like n=1 Tax=Typha angustifolia TaxID=59011 RepID=UPI003C2D2739